MSGIRGEEEDEILDTPKLETVSLMLSLLYQIVFSMNLELFVNHRLRNLQNSVQRLLCVKRITPWAMQYDTPSIKSPIQIISGFTKIVSNSNSLPPE